MDAVFEAPLKVAVTTAVCAAEMLPAVAANVAVLEPLRIATVAGTVSTAMLLDSATVVPVAPAF
jgi:hypothetical protein